MSETKPIDYKTKCTACGIGTANMARKIISDEDETGSCYHYCSNPDCTRRTATYTGRQDYAANASWDEWCRVTLKATDGHEREIAAAVEEKPNDYKTLCTACGIGFPDVKTMIIDKEKKQYESYHFCTHCTRRTATYPDCGDMSWDEWCRMQAVDKNKTADKWQRGDETNWNDDTYQVVNGNCSECVFDHNLDACRAIQETKRCGTFGLCFARVGSEEVVIAGSPPPIETTHAIILECDQADNETIREAIGQRESWGCMPDGDSCSDGAALAEICRGWLEGLAEATKKSPATNSSQSLQETEFIKTENSTFDRLRIETIASCGVLKRMLSIFDELLHEGQLLYDVTMVQFDTMFDFFKRQLYDYQIARQSREASDQTHGFTPDEPIEGEVIEPQTDPLTVDVKPDKAAADAEF